MFFQTLCDHFGFLFVSADHHHGFQTVLLPLLKRFCSLHDQFRKGILSGYPHFFSVADNRLHRIHTEAAMVQDIRCKFRYFNGVSITLLQQTKIIKLSRQHQLSQFLPVGQTIIQGNVLSHISHNRVGTFTEAIFQRAIHHHAKVLGFIDHHMTGFSDNFRFLESFIQISQCGQIIHIERILRNFRSVSCCILCLTEPGI